MTAASNNSKNTFSAASSSIRRREKRRHENEHSVSDPLALLSLAVRVDESSSQRHGLPLLEEPLETGRLYNTDDYVQALEFLNVVTKAPTFTTRRSSSSSLLVMLLEWALFRPTQPYPTVALTPVILSGLIAAQRRRSDDATSSMNSTELLSHCNAMRRAALERIKWERQRKRIQRLAMVLIAILFLVALYLRNMKRMKETVMELGYLGVYQNSNMHGYTSTKAFLLPCASTVFTSFHDSTYTGNQHTEHESKESSNNEGWKRWLPSSSSTAQQVKQAQAIRQGWSGYQEACFHSEAKLWAHFRDYTSVVHQAVRICQGACDGDFRFRIQRHLGNIPGRSSLFDYPNHGPYAMHTIAQRNPHMLTGSRGFREQLMALSSMDAIHQQDTKQQRGECDAVNQDLIWLGDSTVHGLIRKHLEKQFNTGSSQEPIHILDVGCGVGALAFALADPFQLLQDDLPESCWYHRRDNTRPQFRYHGISISAAEVWHARTLAKDHGMDLAKVKFEQQSFDDDAALANGVYSAAVAVESLSYSLNITTTLSVLSRALQPGGTLVVVNDVASGFGSIQWEDGTDHAQTSWQPTLLSHGQWLNELEKAGFVVEEAIDLGLHYELPELISQDKPNNVVYKFYKWLQRQLYGTDPFLQTIQDDNATPFGNSLWNGIGTRFKSVDPLMKFLQSWQDWIGPMAGTDYLEAMRVDDDEAQFLELIRNFASLRIVQIFQGHFRQSRGETLRKEAHRSGDVTYNMYICRKL